MYKIFRRNLFKSVNKKNEKMKALQYDPKERTLEVIEKLMPKVTDNKKVVLKLAYAGINNTDLKIIAGHYPIDECKEIILGHEICGIVCKCTKKFEIGDRVVVDPTQGCHVCDHCREKNVHYCKQCEKNYLGIYTDGGWQDFCVVPESQLYKLPENLDFEDAILVYPMSCISHTWDLLNPIPLGQRILINGAGIIGNLFAALFHLKGHRNVTICDENINKLKILLNLNTLYDLITPDILERQQFQHKVSNLYDVIIDCSGNSESIEKSIYYLNYGGKFCIFGITNSENEINISPYCIFRKELQIFAAKLNPFSFPKAFSIIEIMNSRYINYEKLGIMMFDLCEYRQALRCLREGTISKAVFSFIEPENTQM